MDKPSIQDRKDLPQLESILELGVWMLLIIIASFSKVLGLIELDLEKLSSIMEYPVDQLKILLEKLEQQGHLLLLEGGIKITGPFRETLPKIQERKESAILYNIYNLYLKEKKELHIKTFKYIYNNTNNNTKKKKDLNRKKKKAQSGIDKVASEAILYLNKQAGKNFRLTQANLKFVRARLKEGYTIQDMKKVVDLKCKEWAATEMRKYLRPETLFNATKFNAYINEFSELKSKPSKYKNIGMTVRNR